MAVLPGPASRHVRRHGEALAKHAVSYVRSWAARHAFLAAWAVLSAVIAGLLLWRGQQFASAVVFGIALGLAATAAPFLFDPVPLPLSRQHLPMRLPFFRTLCRVRYWANPFYVESITLRSPYRPTYCSEQLKAAVLPFPWLPIAQRNIAGRILGTGFVLKRFTLWADSGRPTAAGRFVDAQPGTLIELRVAAPAVGVYFLLILGTVMAAFAIAAGVTAVTSAPSRTPALLIVSAAAVVVLVIMAIVASPLSPNLPFVRQRSEADRYIAFFSEVLGADLVSRD